MPELTIYDRIEFDEEGFRCAYLQRKVLWKDVVRVAHVRWVLPDELWFEDYWAFQTPDPEFLLLVEAETINGMRFGDEIRRRYNVRSRPAPIDPSESNKTLIKNVVVYPETDLGKPLYKMTKKHWYSSDFEIEFYQI